MNTRWNAISTMVFVFWLLATNSASATPITINVTADVNQGQEFITVGMSLDENFNSLTGVGKAKGGAQA